MFENMGDSMISKYNVIQPFTNRLGEVTLIHRNNVAGMKYNKLKESEKYKLFIFIISPLHSTQDGFLSVKDISYTVTCDDFYELKKYMDWFEDCKITVWDRICRSFRIITSKGVL